MTQTLPEVHELPYEHVATLHEEQIRRQRLKYFSGPTQKERASLDLLGGTVGTRGTLPIMFDFSIWQKKTLPDGTISTGVDWKTLSSFPQIAGGICKMGQGYGIEKPMQSKNSDLWFDKTWQANFQALHDNGLFRGGYIYHDTSWPLKVGMHEGGFDSIWDGTIEEVAQKLITNDRSIYIAARLMTGLGRVFTASQMKNERRKWVGDEIAFDFEAGYIDGTDRLIGDVWAMKTARMTLDGMTFLMDNGYLDRYKMLVYSSPWYFNNFKLFGMKEVLGHYDSWVAGYYWNEKYGYRHVTIPQLVDDLNSIPDAWHAEYFGAVDPGDVVLAEQISAAHTMDYVKNDLGKPSAVDVNVIRIGWQGLFNRYPEFAKRYKAHHSDVTPPPPPPPPIEIVTKKVATTLVEVNQRKTPSMTAQVQNVSPRNLEYEVKETKVVNGQTWHKVTVPLDVWMAETTPDKKITILKITEKPV